jgi:hypothetical protein
MARVYDRCVATRIVFDAEHSLVTDGELEDVRDLLQTSASNGIYVNFGGVWVNPLQVRCLERIEELAATTVTATATAELPASETSTLATPEPPALIE